MALGVLVFVVVNFKEVCGVVTQSKPLPLLMLFAKPPQGEICCGCGG